MLLVNHFCFLLPILYFLYVLVYISSLVDDIEIYRNTHPPLIVYLLVYVYTVYLVLYCINSISIWYI